MAWSIGQQLIRQGLTAGFMVVLANRITPTELGIVGIANIWNSFLALFLELGFGAALIQRKEITPVHVASVFAVNLVCGVVLMFCSMAASSPVSVAMKTPAAQPVIFILSIGFVFTALASVQNALAQRELRFKALALRDFAANSIASAMGLILAAKGFGVWAVVAHSLLLNFLGMVFIWRLAAHRVRLRNVRFDAIRELWPFGSQIFGYSILKHFLRNMDSIIIGSLFGPERLGIYNFAQRVAFSPVKGIQAGLSAFLFPRASQIQEDAAKLQELYILAYKALNYLLLLFSIGLITVGVDLVPLVFGNQWVEAKSVIRIMCLALITYPAFAPLGDLIKATNHPSWLILWTASFTALISAGLFLSRPFGFNGAVIAFVICHFAALPIVLWMVRMTAGIRIADLYKRTAFSYASLGITWAAAGAIWSVWSPSHPFGAAVAVVIIAVAELIAGCKFDPDLRRMVRIIPARFRPSFLAGAA